MGNRIGKWLKNKGFENNSPCTRMWVVRSPSPLNIDSPPSHTNQKNRSNCKFKVSSTMNSIGHSFNSIEGLQINGSNVPYIEFEP